MTQNHSANDDARWIEVDRTKIIDTAYKQYRESDGNNHCLAVKQIDGVLELVYTQDDAFDSEGVFRAYELVEYCEFELNPDDWMTATDALVECGDVVDSVQLGNETIKLNDGW